jgi:hypothetical protein
MQCSGSDDLAIDGIVLAGDDAERRSGRGEADDSRRYGTQLHSTYTFVGLATAASARTLITLSATRSPAATVIGCTVDDPPVRMVVLPVKFSE